MLRVCGVEWDNVWILSLLSFTVAANYFVACLLYLYSCLAVEKLARIHVRSCWFMLVLRATKAGTQQP